MENRKWKMGNGKSLFGANRGSLTFHRSFLAFFLL